MSLDRLMATKQYSLAREEKESLLLPCLTQLTRHHQERSPEYAAMLAAMPTRSIKALADVSFLPVSMFKTHRLASVPDDEVFKVLTSSGTSGQQVSRIILDRDAADLQSHALAAIMTHTLGSKRLPMIIVDTPNVARVRKSFSARGAGVLGMMSYGRKHFYALDDEMNLDVDGLREFLATFKDEPILVFGFTFMVWKYLLARVAPGRP